MHTAYATQNKVEGGRRNAECGNLAVEYMHPYILSGSRLARSVNPPSLFHPGRYNPSPSFAQSINPRDSGLIFEDSRSLFKRDREASFLLAAGAFERVAAFRLVYVALDGGRGDEGR